MAQQGGKINFQIGFKTDKTAIEEIKKSLQSIQNIKITDFGGTKEELKDIKDTAAEVERALNEAFNPNIKSINLKTFDTQLGKSKITINDISEKFSKLGPQGQVAFSQVARTVLTTNQELKQTSSLINDLGTTFINAMKYNIAGSIFRGFTESIQGAFQYVESLEKSLTDIRIVTGDSQEKMQQFADSANRAAQAIGRSTMDYSKAALTFYQQGLDDQAVAERTQTVLQAQNITGAGSEMADYLTAVWNGYKVANEQAQLYVDKMAAVADTSASNMSQLAIATSKVASTASAMGVNVDQLNASLATVIATTRQAPQAVGTAFKTIFTRLNDIKAGTDDAEISLGNYSGKMAQLGFNVLDATGHLRDTGQVMEEIGQRWDTLTRQQQIYLATTMGGQRQVNQLMALFENWTTYSELLNTSLQAEGTLAEKNSRYMESLGAKMEKLGAAGERVKASLIDSESFGGIIDILTTGTNLLSNFIQAIGGGGSALLGLGGIATQVFSGVIAKEINNAVINFQNMRFNAQQTQKELEMVRSFGQSQNYNEGAIKQMLQAKSQIQGLYSVMTEEQRNSYNQLVNSIGAAKEQVILQEQKVEKAKQFERALATVAQQDGATLKQQINGVKEYTENIQELLKTARTSKDAFADLLDATDELRYNLGTTDDVFPESLKNLYADLDNLKQKKDDIFIIDENSQNELNEIDKSIREKIEEINNQAKILLEFQADTKGLEQAQNHLNNLRAKAEQTRATMEQTFNIRSVVTMVGAVGQLSSALMSIKNIPRIINDQDISAGQKLLKVVSALSYSIPSLVTAFGKINNVLQLTQTLRVSLDAAITKNNVLMAAETGQTSLLTAAKIKLTAAQSALNTAMIANPVGAFVVALTGLIAIIGVAVTVYDKFTMSTKEAEQAIDNFNNKVQQTRNTVTQYNKNINNLDSAKKEWEELSKRAGHYNSTIDNLTESEKQRYFELSNLIAEYNEDAVAGYDAQGNAIIANNEALKETIQLLKQKRQEQINNTYNSPEYHQSQRGRQEKYKQATKSTSELESAGKDIVNYLNRLNNNMTDEQSEIKAQIEDIIAQGRQGIYKNRNQLLNLIESVYSKLDSSQKDYLNDNFKEWLSTAKENEKLIEDSIDGLKDSVLIALQATKDSNQTSIFQKAKQAGISNIEGMVAGYYEGLKERGQLEGRSSEDIAKEINEQLIQPMLDTFGKTDSNGISLYQKLLDSISNDEKLQKGDFLNLEEKNQYIKELLENFFQENLDTIKELSGASDKTKAAFQQLFVNMFNIDGNLKINFDTGKVQDVIVSKIDTLRERISNKVRKDNIQLMPSKEEIAALLPSDITNEELDNITERIEELINKTGSWRQALALALKDGGALANLNTNLDTVGLLNKQAAGEKLSDKETTALNEGLDILKRSYSDLQNEVEILNTEWLQGTSQYENALSKVKGALLETLVQSVAEIQGEDQRLQKQEEVNDSIINMTTSMEDLQQAWFALNLEGQQNALIKVASGYESCKNEIQAYTLALKGNDEEAKKLAANDLARATYAAERGQQYGIEAERISELADEYARLAAEGQAEYAGLDQNAELAADAATRYIRLNDAIADLQKNYDSMTQLLNAFASDSQNLGDIIADNSKAYASLKKDLAGIIDVSEDMMDQDWGDWISDNADLIKQAMEGSQEAIDALRESAAQKIELDIGDNVNIDGLLSKLDESYDSVADWANSLPEGQITGNNLDFIQSLTDALNEAGYTADEIEDIFSGMGIDIDLADQVADAMNEATEVAEEGAKNIADAQTNAGTNVETQSSTATSEDVKQDTEIDANLNEVSGTVDVPTYRPTAGPWGVFYDYAGTESHAVRTYGVSIDTKPVEEKETKETTATALKVVGATKSSGGRVSHKNSSGGNKKSSGGKGKKGGKKGGKGKKGKSSTPKTPKVQKPITDKPDRYHDVNLRLKDIDNELDKVQKKQDKLTGKELLKNLEEQLKLLEKQVDTYKQKIELEKQQADQLRNSLRKQGFNFDQNGNITNYATGLSKALADYNKAIEKYNKMSAEDQQKNKNLLDDAKQKYETIKKNIQRYDKIISEQIPGLEKSIQDALDKQTEINIQKFKMKVDLQLDLSQAEREFNQFNNKVVKQLRDNDVLGQAKASFKDLSSYYKSGYDVIEGLTNQVSDTLRQIKNIDNNGFSAIYGKDRAAALKDLNDYMETLMQNLEDVEDKVKEIKEAIFDAIDKAQDSFDQQKKEYEYISDLIDHNKEVVQLLYGQDAYKELQKYYKLQEKNNNKEMDFLRRQKNMWYDKMQEEQNRMNNLDKNSNAYYESQERFEQYKKHWMDATKELNSLMESSIENIIDKYLNNIDKIFKKLEDKLTNNKGLQNISEEWQLINQQADMYLDKVNSMYEIDKLENAYKDAIDDNEGNLKAQQSLNNLMNEQLKYLKDKDKLTKYDVDRANALLQIQIKRLALEQARQSKTKLRLRRDAQGNYTYQYTADEDASRKAQQELAEAENSLYNLTKQAYKNNLNDYYNTTEQFNDKIKQVYKDTTLSAEEQNQKIAMLYQHYGNIINGLTQQNEDLKKFMMEDTFNEMAKMYNTDVENFKAMTDEQKNTLMEQMIPYWKSGIQEMADTVSGAGGFAPVTKDAFKELKDTTKDYKNSLKEVSETAGQSLNDIKKGLDKNISRTEKLLDKNKQLINGYKDEISAVQDVINNVEKLASTYQTAKKAAIDATKQAYNFTQAQNKDVNNKTKKDNNSTAPIATWQQTGTKSGGQNIKVVDSKTLPADAVLLMQSLLSSSKKVSFDTGGYTGTWGKTGKNAIVHEKELILNKKDTENILTAIHITRTLDNILSNFSLKNDFANALTGLSTSVGKQELDQHVTISATFPNVKQKTEIQEAFKNLMNKASQFAYRSKK